MSQIFYGGLELQIVKTNLFAREPIYSEDGADYLYSHFLLDASCVLSPGATSYGASNPAVPGTEPAQAGRGVLGALTDVNVRNYLQTPRRTLIYKIGGITILESPRPGQVVDDHLGPRPLKWDAFSISGGRLLMVHFRIETWIKLCPDSTSAILSHRWRESHQFDDNFFCTRLVEGEAVFRRPERVPGNRPPDFYRDDLNHPVPNRFQREGIVVSSASSGTRLQYQLRDRQQYLGKGATNPATKIRGVFKVANKFAGETGAKSFVNVKVSVEGKPTSSKFDLFKEAVAVALDRLAIGFQVPGPFRLNPDVIMQAEGTESLDQPFVELEISAIRTPTVNGKQIVGLPIQIPPPEAGPGKAGAGNFLSTNAGSLSSDELLNPDPSRYSQMSGEWNAIIAAVALGSACSPDDPASPQLPARRNLKAGGKSLTGGPSVDLYVSDTTLAGTDTDYTNVTDGGIWTDCYIQVSYETTEHNIQTPIAGRTDGSSASEDRGCAIIAVAQPMTRKVVKWTVERVGEKPTAPSPSPKSGEVCLSRKQGGLIPDLMPDGRTIIYRYNGEYVFALTSAKTMEDDFALGALWFHAASAGDDQGKIDSTVWQTGILG